MEQRIAVVIPARVGSTRIPKKPLQKIGSRELVVRVCDAVSEARLVHQLLVATDDETVRDTVRSYGYDAVLTSPDHETGTERVAEAADSLDATLIVNVQGDEPFLPARALDGVVRLLLDDPGLPLATLAVPLESEEDFLDPNTAKVVVDEEGSALYFSRAPIPHPWGSGECLLWKHVGVYAFRREALFRFVGLSPSPLERREGLEQLRALYHGMNIRVSFCSARFHGVETWEDLERARHEVERGGSSSPDEEQSEGGFGK
jgi:3-deoxy-manno-octulosonate cytidylyltransferase (CMP-KDO synthetase)